MIEIRDCDDFEAAKELILEYSKIKGAESCFVSLDKELADLEGFYRDGALLLGYDEKKACCYNCNQEDRRSYSRGQAFIH